VSDHVYRIGHTFEVRTDLGCLRRIDGEEVSLRPKTFQILVYLVRNRHRLVTKDELTQHIWADTAVTDDAIVQCIVELRKALGDAAREPRYVRTLPKLGYRFLADVEDIPVAEPVVRASTPAPVVAVQEIRRWWPMPFAVGVVGLLVAALFARNNVNAGGAVLDSTPGKAGIAVMYLDNQSRSPEIDWMRQGLAEMLISGLSRSERLNVLGRRQLQTLMDRVGQPPDQDVTLETALEVARRSKASYVVLGSFTQVGPKTRIDVHLEDLSSRRLATESLTVDRPEDVLTQVDLLAWKLSTHFNAGLAEPTVVPAAGLTTNLDAYRYYSLGLSKAIAYHNQEAIDLFQRALDLDPTFVLARARIGYVYAVTWPHPEKARPYLAEAYRAADRLRESDRLLIEAWHAIANTDYSAAITALQRLIKLYPYEIEAYDRLARLLNGESRMDEGVEIVRRGLLLDPDSPDLYNTLGGLYTNLGRPADAIAAHERYVALAPDEPNSHDSLGLSFQSAGRYAEAETAYLKALELNPDFDVALVHMANVYYQTGRYRSAIAAYHRYIAKGLSSHERGRGYHALTFVYARRRDWKQAYAFARNADAEARLRLPNATGWTSVFVALEDPNPGPPAGVWPAQSQWAEESARGSRHSDRFRRYLVGRNAIREGRPREGLEQLALLQRATPIVWSVDNFDDALANAYLERREFDKAIAEYQRILAANPRYPRAHYHLGLAYHGKGMRAAAQQAFQQFLSVWSNADSDVPEIVDAKARLALKTN
jgi:tetratricopeptide (TPR) repeat protein/DNA-binding winged helix-turn-helix (wHTH) protein